MANSGTDTSSTLAPPAVENPAFSPRSRSGGGERAVSVSSPWNQIVRGESEAIAAATSSPDVEESPESGVEGNAGRRPAWKRPSNGATSPETTLIGGESWPALSETVRAPSIKPSNTDSYKALSDGSSSLLSTPRVTMPPTSQNQTPGNINMNLNSTPNHMVPSRQRSMKHSGGNASANANGGNAQPPGSQGPAGESYLNSSSHRDHTQRYSQSRSASDHPQQPRNSFRNRNGGPHSRGDGSYNNGGRHDHDRYFSGRDANMQPRRGVPRFMRHAPPPSPPPTPPYIPAGTFGNPLGYPEFPFYSFGPPPDPLRGMHFYPGTVAPFLVAVADPQLHSKILNQIDYYFSDENLVKDTFLRQNMDEQGWVSIRLIAGFNRVLRLTDNIQLILDAIRSSLVVEVQGDRVRRRNDWMRWIMPSAVRSPNVSAVQTYGNPSHDTLVENFRNISLEEQTIDQSNAMGQVDACSDVFLGRSFSGDLANQSQLSMNEETGPHGRPRDSSHSISARN